MPVTAEQRAEIDRARTDSAPTRRPTVTALEERLFEPLPVLDHGFVRAIDYMGDDAAIVQAARVSYGRGTRRARDDRGLIRYLMRHWHSTPFEMCEIKLHVKLPVFVARQWIRHRTANVNEYSARYSILDREFYTPAPEHLAEQATSNRQGREGALSPEQAEAVREILRADAQRCFDDYEELLNRDETGARRDPDRPALARELARINLTLNCYTQWYWKTDLHNLMHFLHLRGDSHAQAEIAAYARAIEQIMAAWVPIAHEAFQDYRQGAVQLSAQMRGVVRRMLDGESVTAQTSGLTAREWAELMAALGREG